MAVVSVNYDAQNREAISQNKITLLYINVKNVQGFAGTMGSLFLTAKQDKALHGYGSKIFDDIVRKYDGQITRTVVHWEFIADVMLDMCWQDAQLTVRRSRRYGHSIAHSGPRKGLK